MTTVLILKKNMNKKLYFIFFNTDQLTKQAVPSEWKNPVAPIGQRFNMDSPSKMNSVKKIKERKKNERTVFICHYNTVSFSYSIFYLIYTDTFVLSV